MNERCGFISELYFSFKYFLENALIIDISPELWGYTTIEIKFFFRDPNCIFKSYFRVLHIETSTSLDSLAKFEGAIGQFKLALRSWHPLILSPGTILMGCRQLLSLVFSEIDLFLLHLTCGRPVFTQLHMSYQNITPSIFLDHHWFPDSHFPKPLSGPILCIFPLGLPAHLTNCSRKTCMIGFLTLWHKLVLWSHPFSPLSRTHKERGHAAVEYQLYSHFILRSYQFKNTFTIMYHLHCIDIMNNISIYLSFCLSTYHLYLSTYLSIYLSVYLPIYIYLSIYLPTYLVPTYLPTYLPIYLSIYIFIYIYTHTQTHTIKLN